MIGNPKHVKDLRDALHAAIAGYGIQNGLGEGDLQGGDVMVALAFVMRDVVQGAPDSASRGQLIREAVSVLTAEATRPQLIHPAGHRLHS